MSERHICTVEDPWTPEKGKRVIHPNAREVGEQENGWPAGDIVTFECPICGTRWKKELPQ